MTTCFIKRKQQELCKLDLGVAIIAGNAVLWKLVHGLYLRQPEHKCRTFTRLRFNSDESIMFFDDLLAYRQPDTGSFEFVIAVQPFKHHKYFIGIFWVKSNSIIGHADLVIAAPIHRLRDVGTIEAAHFFRLYLNYRLNRFFSEFDRIAEEVVK